MKANPDKCHLITASSDEVIICIENHSMKSSKCKKRLIIKVDNKLNSDNHIDEICKKAAQKLNALSGVTVYMDLPKRCMLSNAFFYLNSVWIFHSLGRNQINRLHERCLRIICSDKKSTFIDYWKIINMSQFINETYVSL